ncbi:hypothetical protein KTH_47560 [Thermosporothrix hazakensis]|nr:hypothetical protein KTH_47560 [Thermosporothrix hazakensis]
MQETLTRHLLECVACREEVRQLRALAVATRQQAVNFPFRETPLWQAIQSQLEEATPRLEALPFLYQPVRRRGWFFWGNMVGMLRMQWRLLGRDVLILPLFLMLCMSGYWGLATFTALPLLNAVHLVSAVFAFLVSFFTAGCMAFLFSAEDLRVHALARTTNTPIFYLLLLRFLLVLVVTTGTVLIGVWLLWLLEPSLTFQWALTEIFAPLCGLVACALFVASLSSAGVALGWSGILWLLRALSYLPQDTFLKQMYEPCWHQGALLFPLASLVCLVALWIFARRSARRTGERISAL